MYNTAWDLPEYIESGIGEDYLFKFQLKLGRFTSQYIHGRIDLPLSEIKSELDGLSDYEIGEWFMDNQLDYQTPNFNKYYPTASQTVMANSKEEFFADLGLAIRGRIPYAYAKWYLRDRENAPSQITYETAYEIWE